MNETAAPSDHAVPRVILVTSPACHQCDDAHAVLAPLADQGDIELNTVEADSTAGAALIRRHRPAMFPLVLLEGNFFSAGRLPRGKLSRALRAAGVAL